VLPATAHAEKTGTFTNTNRQIQRGRPAVDPPGEARPDWWIVQELAKRLGLDWRHEDPKDVYAEMRSVMPSLKGISWERLAREGAVTYPCDAEDQPGRPVLFADGFPTPSGKGTFVPAAGTEPDEEPDARYPMVLTTGRMLEHWHTGAMTRRAPVLDALEPAAVASLHPDRLAALDVAPGARVRIESRRGVIEIATRADARMPPDMVFVPFCFAEAAANLLTNPKLDPWGKIPELKYCAVRVEKIET
jgi:formate dehydrogenase major subunit